jgi:branched-chain amino acid transport system ATP-binding protein
MLVVEGLAARYGAVVALHGVSLHVDEGELVALVGPNGAGKTTLLGTVAGLVRPAAGRVLLDGRDVTGQEPARLVRCGLALVPEHRRIFGDLTVGENLQLAGITAGSAERRQRLDEARQRFPVLADRWSTAAGYLSGGEAQQLAVARALMSDPRLVLLDEPTLGLAPIMVDVVFELLQDLRARGRTLLVVEQNARRALEIADRGYLLRTGRIALEGAGPELAAHEDLFGHFVGAGRSGPPGGAPDPHRPA